MENNDIKRTNAGCAYFPCHSGLQDCTFCYCPLYPCLDNSRGKYVLLKKKNKRVWSCRECNWIHKKRIVDKIFDLIREKETAWSAARRIEDRQGTGVIILAHGSKRGDTKETARRISQSLKKNLGLKYIIPAYLQLCRPALSEAVELLVSKGCRKIVVIPYFLFKGNHVMRDVPAALQREKEKFSRIEFVYAKALGEDEEKISQIVARKILEAL